MLHIGPFLWGDKYGPEYVERLQAGIARHLKQPHEFHVFKPDKRDRHLTEIKGCFARLRAFDPEWQWKNGIGEGERIVVLDLDLIVTGGLDELFDRPEQFLIFQGANSSNPCPYNGSLWMLRAGYRPDVWSGFSLTAAQAVEWDSFPDDQAWFADRLPDAAGWKAGTESGVYAFKKPGWPSGDALPPDARIVAFPGARDPAQFVHLDWVAQHWRT